ncbi:DUF1788 domain-containing protein [Microvenator marinus]|uniref:DUF1788 domain-containing protein n=1 Tax=Microvenator marinus TaxID=2600177 RepID=A0A5B8XSB9_9DELT|nr:BREX protein BrxB domain-containing protein [Microvenator marinus]QED28444.1 DUF1788 domain-containing protein [Microvenator marinus]
MSVKEAVDALRRDLIQEDGPQISTMRNFRFAILQYLPTEEFKLREEIQRLSEELKANGWMVLALDLHAMLLERLRAQPDDWVERVIRREKLLSSSKSPEHGLNELRERLRPQIEGPNGLAKDCSKCISEFINDHQDIPDFQDRTLVLLGRAGALHPFLRPGNLLRHLDGHTNGVPVILLYPGEREGQTGLKFMGIDEPDNDYRPRIYS